MKVVVLVLMVAALALSASAQKRTVCYMSSWAVYRSGEGRFDASRVDPFLCTHLIYAFVGTNPDASVKLLDAWNDINLGGFKKFNDLRLKNPALKTLIAVGGWNEGSVGFSNICRDPTLRARFVDNLFNFVLTHNFNGVDIDWEFPAQRGGIVADKANFASLTRELKAKFGPADLLVSAAVSAGVWVADVAYDVPQLSANLDFINLMSYDYHGTWDGRTGHVSPLYPAAIDADKTLNVQSTVKYWVERGVDRSKLVLGVPLYGRSFHLKQPSNTNVGAPSSGAGAPGQFSQEAGMLMYSEICRLQRRQTGWTVRRSGEQQVAFTYRAFQWVGYEDVRSLAIKGEFAKQQQLGGVMVYALEMDDFSNTCANGTFPLLKALNAAFSN